MNDFTYSLRLLATDWMISLRTTMSIEVKTLMQIAIATSEYSSTNGKRYGEYSYNRLPSVLHNVSLPTEKY